MSKRLVKDDSLLVVWPQSSPGWSLSVAVKVRLLS
jgi:hypothetical protein